MQSRTLSASIQRALLAMAAVSAGALSATSALAQESEDAATLDTIEVTGSRLKRADIEGAVPVIVIDRA